MAIAVIDIGKTNAKLALVDLAQLAEIAVRRTPNEVVRAAPYPHFDVERLWTFILDSLRDLAREAQIEAISITTHGATGVLLAADGSLALPILDYEHTGIEDTRAAYEKLRPPFAESGTPPLATGLNLGAQFYWQQQSFPAAWAEVTSLLMYAQYWGFRLTGHQVSEATSLGCHTDLWAPADGTFSSMVGRLGWTRLFPPMAKAADRLGTLLPAIAERTGLPATTPVHVGIHDSNASLLPHLLARRAPFAVLSTGTWVISLAVGARTIALDPARDTLINVNALGQPTPSARFMGGRENAILGEELPPTNPAAIERVLGRGLMYLPAAQQGSGPFPHNAGRWTGDGTPAEQRAALSFYLALMAATCLDLIGADGPTIIEGPFAANTEFASMLRAATGRDVIIEAAGTGTSIGAALLAGDANLKPGGETISDPGSSWSAYAAAWREAVGALGAT
ncbi:MAG: carbohydrate kinase [Hyphomicrobiales bacterium]|nr:MAG: carbohydrate kinase [Hyphomicrobiales bacterium]